MVQTTRADMSVGRMLIYRFLNMAYSYPDTAFAVTLMKDGLWDELRALGEAINLRDSQTFDDMQVTFGQYDNDTQRLLQDLQVEYTYLFINAVPRVPAPPYESVYSGHGLLMGEPVSEVLKTYREAGLSMREDYNALPDHIAAELEFMFYLVQQEATAGETAQQEAVRLWRERQYHFLAEHLLRWLPALLERIAAHARHPFYRLLAMLTGAVLDSEKKHLGITVLD